MPLNYQLAPMIEKETGTIPFRLRDEDGGLVLALDSMTLTLYNQADGSIINGRDAQNVLNANNVSFANGLVSWSVQTADTPIVDDSKSIETHMAVFYMTWNLGQRSTTHRVRMDIENVIKQNG